MIRSDEPDFSQLAHDVTVTLSEVNGPDIPVEHPAQQ
jgi:hypothetical protein